MIPHHPRIRGEHHELASGLKNMSGSSPHSRGTLAWENTDILPSGIIPAFAGNTMTALLSPMQTWDHPRIRGEHSGKICISYLV